jgi:hypothetical protein
LDVLRRVWGIADLRVRAPHDAEHFVCHVRGAVGVNQVEAERTAPVRTSPARTATKMEDY